MKAFLSVAPVGGIPGRSPEPTMIAAVPAALAAPFSRGGTLLTVPPGQRFQLARVAVAQCCRANVLCRRRPALPSLLPTALLMTSEPCLRFEPESVQVPPRAWGVRGHPSPCLEGAWSKC